MKPRSRAATSVVVPRLLKVEVNSEKDLEQADDIPEMKKKGGLVVPLLQREAMCITFGFKIF